MTVKRLATLSIATLTLAGCSLIFPGRSQAPSSETPPPTDAGVLGILATINEVSTLSADLALAKSHDQTVRDLATTIKTDHNAVRGTLNAFSTRRRITPDNHVISDQIRATAERRRLELRELEGVSFDSAYIATEAATQRSLVAMIDNALTPNTQNSELRTLLSDVRSAVSAHHRRALALSARP